MNWLLYHYPNFKYCTLFECGTELRRDRQTDAQTGGQTDDPISRCPGGPQAWHKKRHSPSFLLKSNVQLDNITSDQDY